MARVVTSVTLASSSGKSARMRASASTTAAFTSEAISAVTGSLAAA